MIRVSSVASANFAGISAKPGASTRMMAGMKISPRRVRANSQKASTLIASSANRRAAAGPSAASRPENSGTNAALNAPSPNRRRNKLGSLFATKKASAIGPVPASAAIRMSRRNPSKRLAIVQPPTVRTPRSMARI